VGTDELGIYDESLLATGEQRQIHKQVMDRAFKLYNQPYIEGGFYNTGVMVLSQCHQDLFRLTDKPIQMDYAEQPYLNIKIRQLRLKIYDIGHRFNRMQYVSNAVGQNRLSNYIIHYAGIPERIVLMKKDVLALTQEKA
jgi:hypothetical protein